MCGGPAGADEMLLASRARAAADDLLSGWLRLPVDKAMDLGTPRGFDRAVAALAAQLRARASASDDAAVREAVRVLDVDWRSTTAQQRSALVAQALEAAGRRTAAVPRAVQAVFGKAAIEVVGATREGARGRQRLAIAGDFNALDRRIVRHLTTSQANFVRDEYGRRHEVFGEQARRIVADGLEAGLGREDIARDLAEAAQAVIAGRGSFYWEVVAGAFVANGRSFAQMSAFAEAGIQRYEISAVLDEHTTEICRYLDGKQFEVGDALGRFDRIESLDDPEDIKAAQPWVREALDPETGRKVLYVESGGRNVPIAEVTRSAVGTRDDRGEFARGRSERELMDLGVSFPPYHGLCRSSALPVV
ncbi:MAG: head morphogenesis protein [Phyllobacteriaceae bacterium]|nr:head morphogenesis protein [Phyllobacteriaceae bacterium]